MSLHWKCCKIPGFQFLKSLNLKACFGNTFSAIPVFPWVGAKMCKSPSRSDLVLIAFWALTTSSNFFEPNTGNLGLLALKVLQMPGFGGLLALKVLQIPGFGGQIPVGGLLALKTLPRIWGTPCTENAANSRIWGSHCTESAANSKTWWPDTVNFQGLGGSSAWKQCEYRPFCYKLWGQGFRRQVRPCTRLSTDRFQSQGFRRQDSEATDSEGKNS